MFNLLLILLNKINLNQKSMKTIKNLSLSLLSVITFWSCVMEPIEEPEPQLNIVETAQANPNLSTLVEALTLADLVGALSEEGERTVLAPTNEAFAGFLSINGFETLESVPPAVLKQVLLNHVIDGTNLAATDLTGATGYTNTLATGPNDNNLSIYWDGIDGVIFNGMSVVTTADVDASNGIIHIVDKVIELPTIATFATTNPALGSLVKALSSADSQEPSPMFITTLSDASTGPLTVFTPVNAAFDALLLELDPTGNTALEDLDPSTVEAVLNMHIVGANVQSKDLTTGAVSTLGGDIFIDTSNFTITDGLNRETNIVTSLIDIQAINGVAHVVDRVIRP